MKVKINKSTADKLLDIHKRIRNLQKEAQTILEVYGDASGLIGNIKVDNITWELEDSQPEPTMEVDIDK